MLPVGLFVLSFSVSFLDTDILLLLICFSFQVYMHLECFKCLINETKCILIPIKSSKIITANVSSVLL